MPTTRQIKHRRPDLILWDKDGEKVYVLEVAMSHDNIVDKRKAEKRDKYDELCADLASSSGYKSRTIPLVVGNFGNVDALHTELEKFLIVSKLSELVAKVQRTAVLASVRVLKRHLAM